MSTYDPHDDHDGDPRDFFPLLIAIGLIGLTCIVGGAFIAWMNGSIA